MRSEIAGETKLMKCALELREKNKREEREWKANLCILDVARAMLAVEARKNSERVGSDTN